MYNCICNNLSVYLQLQLKHGSMASEKSAKKQNKHDINHKKERCPGHKFLTDTSSKRASFQLKLVEASHVGL